MKRNISRALCAVLIFAMILCLCSCGSKPSGISGGAGGASASADDIVTEETGKGFTYNQAAAAGFGLGSDRLSDISSRFGAPSSSTTDQYTSLTLTTAYYPFGVFELESTDGGEPVLTYAEITSDIPGPCGVRIGMDMTEAAELMYKGGGATVSQNEAQKVYFYGADGTVPFGSFTILTIEFTSSETDDFYSLDYCANTYEEGKVAKFSMYFDEGGKLIRYTLRYS